MARFQYVGVIQDSAGNAQNGVPVTVSIHGGGPATIYPTEVGGSPLAALVSDLTGSFVFWADNSLTYDITPTGFPSRVIPGSTPGSVGPAGTAGGSYINPAVSPYSIDKTGATDVTSGLNTALAAGSVLLPDGLYRINGVVTVPTSGSSIPDFLGTGSGRVKFLLGASGQIRVGNRTGAGGVPSGGRIGGFTIDGNSVANVTGGGLYLGLITQFKVADLRVQFCVTDNIVIEGAQNCTFDSLFSQWTNGSCMVWDYGMGGCVFTGHTELYGSARYDLEIRQSGASQAGAFPTINGPSYNVVQGGFIEQSIGGVLGATQNLGLLYQGAGTGNVFFLPNGLAGNPSAGPYSLVVVEKANLNSTNAQSLDLTFIGGGFLDNTGRSTGIEQRGNTGVVLIGKTTFQNLVNAFSTWNTDAVTVHGPINYAMVTNKWVKAAASPATSMQSIVRSFEYVRKDVVLNNAADDILVSYLGTDAAPRIDLALSGYWVGDGTFAPLGVTGWEYYTPDAGVTKYLYDPAGIAVGGNILHLGTKSAVNGNTPVVKAAAITTPNTQTAAYVQADVQSLKTAIDALRVALQNFGITA